MFGFCWLVFGVLGLVIWWGLVVSGWGFGVLSFVRWWCMQGGLEFVFLC